MIHTGIAITNLDDLPQFTKAWLKQSNIFTNIDPPLENVENNFKINKYILKYFTISAKILLKYNCTQQFWIICLSNMLDWPEHASALKLFAVEKLQAIFW